MPFSKKGISVFTLTLLITGAIDSIRNLPTTALFGTTLIFFFIISAIVFLIPAALISAELSSTWTDKGGIYFWVKQALGDRIAVIAIWLQWINTMIWFPTILSFIAGTLAYILSPQLTHHKGYLVTVILVVYWGLTLLNLGGVKLSARFASICAIVGMVIPMIIIIILGLIWVTHHHPIQIHFTHRDIWPNFSHGESWISLTAVMTAFLGMELATVHVRDVDNPKKTFPTALLISVALILSTMILGSLAIAFVLPASHIQLVAGIMQAFTSFFDAYHIAWLIPVLAIMILIGSLGGMINWMISPARGLAQVVEQGYLPQFLNKRNRFGVAGNMLILQAILVSCTCLAFLLMPSVNGSYWLLTDLSTQLYMLMYVLMFFSAVIIKYKFGQHGGFHVPGGKLGMWILCGLGLIGCGVTVLVGFIPPTNINVGGFLHYELIFVGGMIVLVVPVLGLYAYKIINKKMVSNSR